MKTLGYLEGFEMEDSEYDRRKDFELEQYKQCYESYRLHDRFIWQIPAFIIAICGTLTVGTFAYVFDQPPISAIAAGGILLMGALISFALVIALIKHRYFSGIEQGTLTEIEKKHDKLIQRVTDPRDQLKQPEQFENDVELDCFWYHEDFTFRPKKWKGIEWIRSAHVWLFWASLLVTLILFVLAVLCFLCPEVLISEGSK